MSLLDALLLDPAPFEVWVSSRTDGSKGSGTHSDPYRATSAPEFDGILNNLPQNVPTRVHLGPNTAANPFLTQGFWIKADGTSGSAWAPRPNLSIVGAGMDLTHLKLELPGSPQANAHYFAGGALTTTLMDNFTLSDLTIDCNLPSASAVACGAVRLMGNHVRIRRVKCKNWGSRTTAQPGFVIALLIADPDTGSPASTAEDAGIEDCVVINPSASNLANTW